MKNKTNRILALLVTVAMILALFLKTNPMAIQADDPGYAEPDVETEYVPVPDSEPELEPEPELYTEEGEAEEVENEPEELYEDINVPPGEEEATEADPVFVPEEMHDWDIEELIDAFDYLLNNLRNLRVQINDILDDMKSLCEAEMSPENRQLRDQYIAILEEALEDIEATIQVYEDWREFLDDFPGNFHDFLDYLEDEWGIIWDWGDDGDLDGFIAAHGEIEALVIFKTLLFNYLIDDVEDWDVWDFDKLWEEWAAMLNFGWEHVDFRAELVEVMTEVRDEGVDLFGFCGPEFNCPCYLTIDEDEEEDEDEDERQPGGGVPTPAPAPAVTAPQTGDVAPASTPLLGVMLSLFLISGGTLLRKRND